MPILKVKQIKTEQVWNFNYMFIYNFYIRIKIFYLNFIELVLGP